MMPDDYLQALRKKLNSFSHDDQVDLIEEVGSHIESGEEDSKMGKDPIQRRPKIMSELGSPGQMAKGFKRVYQPGCLIDYLLIAIPYLLNLPINLLLVSLMPKYPWADARLVIIFHLMLIGIGLWRRSTLLTIYWLADLAIQLLGVLWFVNGYYGPLQTGLWYIVIAALIFQLIRMVWQNRRDLLTVTFAFLPLFMGFLAFLLWNFIRSSTYSYEPLEILFYRIYLNFGNYFYYAQVVMLAPLFLVRNRNVRWFALAVFWLICGINRAWLDYYVIYPSLVYYIWIILPLAVVFLSWSLDHFKRRQFKFAT